MEESVDTKGVRLPDHVQQRLRGHGMSFVEISRAVGVPSGAWWTEQMKGKRDMPQWLVDRLIQLVADIEHGVVEPAQFKEMCVNIGGAYAGTPDDWEPRLPSTPTNYRAGSHEKIEIMARRAEAGLAIHHPQDGKGVIAPDYRPGKGDAICP